MLSLKTTTDTCALEMQMGMSTVLRGTVESDARILKTIQVFGGCLLCAQRRNKKRSARSTWKRLGCFCSNCACALGIFIIFIVVMENKV